MLLLVHGRRSHPSKETTGDRLHPLWGARHHGGSPSNRSPQVWPSASSPHLPPSPTDASNEHLRTSCAGPFGHRSKVHPSRDGIAHTMMNSDIDSIQDTPAIPPYKGSILDEPERPSFSLPSPTRVLLALATLCPFPQTMEYSGSSDPTRTARKGQLCTWPSKCPFLYLARSVLRHW